CVQVAALDPVARVVGDPDHQVEVSGCRRTAALTALAAQPDPLTANHPRRKGDVERARTVGAADRQAALGAVVGLLDGHLHLGLVVGARDRAWAPTVPAPTATPPAAEDPPEQVLDVDVVTEVACSEASRRTGPGR